MSIVLEIRRVFRLAEQVILSFANVRGQEVDFSATLCLS
jgi:hypothetical protein